MYIALLHKRQDEWVLFSKVISMFSVRIHLEPAADNDEGMAGNRGLRRLGEDKAAGSGA